MVPLVRAHRRNPQVTKSAAAPAGVCGTVGATGPGGGKIFYVDMSRAAGSQCFEAAPDGWKGYDPRAVWGCLSADISGAVATGIGTGEANTTAIVNRCTEKGIAARLADDYTGGSQTDWFLPSKDELNQLCKYARGQSTPVASQAVECNNSGALQPGFNTVPYWSSSQFNAYFARIQHFNFGSQGTDDKDNNDGRVRPVRAF